MSFLDITRIYRNSVMNLGEIIILKMSSLVLLNAVAI